jgi:L-threonylcarbamoyladenylate synthase
MEIISNPTQDEIKKAARALKDGHLVAFPTETVYGLGADATNEKAVSRIYSVKGRPTDHPLIVHISSINQLDKWAVDIPEYAIKLAQEFWPGPMTLILKRSELAKDFITGGQDNVGVRVPAHPVALELLSEFEKLGGAGIAAPSANRFGAVSPTSSIDVQEEIGNYLGEPDQILDGGQSIVGIESTIISCLPNAPIILRPGFLTSTLIFKKTGIHLASNSNEKYIKTPGSLHSHYSPKARVVLNKPAKPGEGFIAMFDFETPEGAIRLAAPKTTEEFAYELYSSLRLGDRYKLETIVVLIQEGDELLNAINDRLTKAAQEYNS